MRYHLEIPNVDTDSIFRRLGQRPGPVMALASSTANGWGNRLAWDPVATFAPAGLGPQAVQIELDAFVSAQLATKRLVIGYLSYDFGCAVQGVKLSAPDDIGSPPVYVASFDNWIESNDEGLSIHAADPAFVEEVRAIAGRPPQALPTEAYNRPLRPSRSRAWYDQAFKRVMEHIETGDAYQVNLARRYETTSNATGRELFSYLSVTNPADFRAYLEVADLSVLSFSPERFIRVHDRDIETSPVKGTKPRGATAVADRALKFELQNSPKELAELNMITDLMRNDLGAICAVGSVHVTHTRVLTSYPTLWHAHSTITGRLNADISPVAALTCLMPGGSITGCPKKSAIGIIDSLEAQRRGIYTGSIFTISPNGDLDSSIAIRTMVKKSTNLYLSVAGGIVYGSTSNGEFAESITKARSFMTPSRTPLSSDILESQFGSTAIDVLYQGARTRNICTKVVSTGQILELSRVEFIDEGVQAFPETHRAVVNGESMGKAFRSRGIDFVRQTSSAFACNLPQSFYDHYHSPGPATVVTVTILVGPAKTPYAHILETYSPAVDWPKRAAAPTALQLVSIEAFGEWLRRH
jgi:para-aminobenzoate synthetase component 1